MHRYVIDSDEHKNITVGLAIISVVLFSLLYGQLQAFQQQYPWLQSWWVAAPSMMTAFGIFYAMFNRWLWHWPIFRWLGIVKTPDIRGSWKGYIKSSYDDYTQERPITVIVTQSWTRLLVCLKTESSSSKSVSAAIYLEEEAVPVMRFIYLNSPQPEAKRTMNMHDGTAVVRLEGRETLEGRYYTGRGRSSQGTLVLGREKEKSWSSIFKAPTTSQAS